MLNFLRWLWRIMVGSSAQVFDYIVVGGGTAGCLLASTLANERAGTVLLLEAGRGTQDVRTIVPKLYLSTFGSTIDWQFYTVPQPYLADRRLHWPRGKVLGGSGAINAMIYLQAAQVDFRRWGWHWADSLLNEKLLFHGVPVSPHPWTEAFLDAGAAMGWKRCQPWTQASPNSCGLFSVTQRNGRRQHTGQLLESSSALQLISNCRANRIEIRDGRAVAVHVQLGNHEHQRFSARRSVLLCTGVLGTPKLLMQSGIGPREHLEELGIECLVDSPAVGHNLQDHLVFPLVFSTVETKGLSRRVSVSDRQQYRSSGTGPLTSNVAEAGAIFGSGDGDDINTGCQFQIHFTPTHYLKYPQLETQDNHLSLAVTDLHPRSRGSVRLGRPISQGSNGPDFELLINPNYLSFASERERMLAVVEIARDLAQQSSLRALITGEVLPGARRADTKSLGRAIAAFSHSIYHPIGTCRMASPLESRTEATVVDFDFRVWGVEGLRIADASVLPELPSANTNAVTLLVAKRLSDLLCSIGPLDTNVE